MKEIPVRIDWPVVFQNLEKKTGLSTYRVCRAAKIYREFGGRLINDPGYNPRFDNAVKVINLHLKLLPDAPIPERALEPLSAVA